MHTWPEITSALLGFAAFAVVLTIIPGLDTTLVLRSSLARSKTFSFSTALGIQTGAVVWGVITATGATLLLAASELGYRLLTLAGAIYLVVMGISLLSKGFRKATATDEPLPRLRGNPGKGFGVGVLTNLLNPKVGVFYLATIPQFVPEGVSPLLMGALLAVVHGFISMVWFALVILGGRLLSRRLTSQRFTRWVDRVAGGIILVFGARLALTSATG